MTNRKAIRRARRIRRTVLTVCLMALVAVISIGGTIAWLTAKTQSITNTFTVGNINIKLEETDTTKDQTTGNESKSFDLLPGNDITNKDPKVTVLGGSETCWLFVKVEETNWPAWTEEGSDVRKVDYELADGWELVTGTTNVYSRSVTASDDDQPFYVLKDNTVSVSDTITKTELDGQTVNPTLTIKAYAIQKDNNFTTAADAWAEVSK